MAEGGSGRKITKIKKNDRIREKEKSEKREGKEKRGAERKERDGECQKGVSVWCLRRPLTSLVKVKIWTVVVVFLGGPFGGA